MSSKNSTIMFFEVFRENLKFYMLDYENIFDDYEYLVVGS